MAGNIKWVRPGLIEYPFFGELWRHRVPLFEPLSSSSTSLSRTLQKAGAPLEEVTL
jgi:hypothetical protein